MRKPFRFKRIQRRFSFWFVVIAVLPLIVSTKIIYDQQVSVIKDNQFQKLLSIRDLKVRQLNSWIDEREADVRSFAENTDLMIFAEHEEVNKTEAQYSKNRDEARITLEQFDDLYSVYHEIFIVDARTAQVHLSTNKLSEGKGKSQFSYYKRPLETGDLVFTDIYLSPALNNQPGMTYSIPLRCLQHAGEHITAILVARIDLEHSLYPFLQDRTGMGQTGETLIVSKEGMALNDLRHYQNAPLKLRISAEPAVNAAAGKTGITEIEDYRGEPVLAAYTHIPRTKWGFVSKQDQREVYAPITQMLNNTLLIILFSVLAVYIISYLLSRATVKPIMEMVSVAKRIGEQDYSARIELKSEDETSILADYINDFTESTEHQIFRSEGLAKISRLFTEAEELSDLSKRLIQELMSLTSSQLAGLYILNNASGQFEPFHTIGFQTDKLVSFSANSFEGEFGRVLSTEQISHSSELPEDTIFMYKSILGDALPREVIFIPVIVNYKVQAVIALANLSEFSEKVIDLLNQSWIPLNTGFARIFAQEEVQRIANELVEKNQELESLAEEFKSQADELQEQNIELDLQRSQVEDANQLKTEFLSNMSHELRTPLNSILSLTGVLNRKTSNSFSEEELDYLNIVERNGKQLLMLINNILDLSKIESGEMEVLLTTVDLEKLVESILETMSPIIKEKGLSINWQADKKLPNIVSDESLLLRIIQNLLSNAVKFTEKGEVSVQVTVSNNSIRLVVKDTGIGIPPDKLTNIFEEFRQVDGTMSRKFEGTGLGLSIAKKSSLLLGGDIEVDSIVGQGSTFTLILPVEIGVESIEANPPSSDLEINRSTTPIVKNALTILIVEDQPTALLLINSYLKEAGYQTYSAMGGQAAIDYCKQTIPDGIILDLMMPEIDGFQVLESIRSAPKTQNIPVLILTSKDLTKKDLSRLSANNVAQLVQKGDIDKQQFLRKIETLFHQNNKQISIPDRVKTSPKKQYPGRSNKSIKELSVLIIEDNLDNMIALKALLPKEYTVFEATDGLKGFEMISSKQPDLVLTDIMLPNMDGLAIVREVRADEALREIPLIAVTAKAMKGDKEQYLAAGFDAFVSKPIDPDDLKNKIASIFEN